MKIGIRAPSKPPLCCLGSDSAVYAKQKEYRDSPVVCAARALMENRQRWEGTACELLDELCEISPDIPESLKSDALSGELFKLFL